MNNNIKVQGFNVLTELTHSDVGNPHQQYVGNNRDTMLKPSYDLLNAQNGNNIYWKIAEYEIDLTVKKNITFCFDLFDEYDGLYVDKSSYEINIFQNGETVSSTQYFPNGVVKRINGDDYERVYIVENVVNDKVICSIFIKNVNQWNFPKIAVRYLNTNNTSFKLINNERMIKDLPNGDCFTNIPKTKSLISKTSIEGETYTKLAEFDIEYTKTMKSYVFEITKNIKTSNKKPYYAKIMLQFYNDSLGESAWVSTNSYFIDNCNFTYDDLFIVRDATNNKKFYLYGKFDSSNQVYSIKLLTNLDYSNTSGREITLKQFDIENNIPNGNIIKFKATDIIYLQDTQNKIINRLYFDNWKLKVKNSKEEIVGVVPSPQIVPKSNATDITQMVADFNALIDKLKTAGIVNS